ncbi:unnamed protein product [Orchesella dallaii]|uniref:Uncharacterized protein n=1 Tax=Orchesella dallaii TaxID=48710 RepID=A0ABP1S9W6_9HEXA
MEDEFNDAEARNAGLVEKDKDNKVALRKLKAEKENIELSLKAADEQNQILKSSHDKLANKYKKLKSLAEEALPGYDMFTQHAAKLFGNLSPNPELNKDSSQYGFTDSELIYIASETENKRSFDSDDELGDLAIDESPLKRK